MASVHLPIFTRLQPAGHASASPLPGRRLLLHKLLFRTFVLVVVACLVAIGSAAQEQQSHPQKNSSQSLPVTLEQTEQATPPSNTPAPTSTTITAPGTSVNTSITNGEVHVSVNGQTVPVPDNGTSQQVVTTPDGSATISVTNNNNSGQFTSVNANATSSGFQQQTKVETKYGSP